MLILEHSKNIRRFVSVLEHFCCVISVLLEQFLKWLKLDWLRIGFKNGPLKMVQGEDGWLACYFFHKTGLFQTYLHWYKKHFTKWHSAIKQMNKVFSYFDNCFGTQKFPIFVPRFCDQALWLITNLAKKRAVGNLTKTQLLRGFQMTYVIRLVIEITSFFPSILTVYFNHAFGYLVIECIASKFQFFQILSFIKFLRNAKKNCYLLLIESKKLHERIYSFKRTMKSSWFESFSFRKKSQADMSHSVQVYSVYNWLCSVLFYVVRLL